MAVFTADSLVNVNIGNHPESRDRAMMYKLSMQGLPEFVPNQTVDQEVSSGDQTEEDMGDIAKDMVPDRETFTEESFIYA